MSAATGAGQRPRLLLVSMYPLDAGAWGPTVRIGHLRDALSGIVELDVVDGYRPTRRGGLWRYATSGRLRGLAGAYVEASSFLPAELDVAFLALLRARRIPVLTYFRDAYQLFSEYYPVDSPGRWIAAHAYRPAVRSLAAFSTQVAVPTAGLGRVLFGARRAPLLLPPGAPPPVTIPFDPAARGLLYVGDGRLEAQGAPRLISALRGVRERGITVELTIVSRPGQEPAMEPEPWIHVERANGDEIHRLLPGIGASVIPRPRGAYNDLALPVKLFDYLSYARPLLVTPCEEQRRVVEAAGAGSIVPDDPAGMADAIAAFFARPDAERAEMAAAAADAATGASWRDRARTILDTLGIVPSPAP